MKQMKLIFDSLKNRYQNILETMKGREFVFHYVQLFHFKCHQINPNRGGSYKDSPDWKKNKKVTINPINKKDNKSFQYAVTVTLNYEETGKNAERITKVKSFINMIGKDDWKTFEKNDIRIAFSNLYAKKEKTHAAYASKNNSNHEKQVILFMFSNTENSDYLAVKKFSALLRGTTSKNGNFYCLDCFHSFRTKKLESHKKLCENNL